MKTKAIGAALLALLLLSAQAAAAQPSPVPATQASPSERKLELARELVKVTGMDTVMLGAFRKMAAQITASAGAGVSPEREARLKVIGDAEGDALAKVVPQIVQGMVAGYAQTFTEQELSDMLAFYRSPSGRSMVSKMPRFTEAMMVEIAGLMPQVRRDMGTDICAKVTCSAAERAAYFGPGSANGGSAAPSAAPQAPAVP